MHNPDLLPLWSAACTHWCPDLNQAGVYRLLLKTLQHELSLVQLSSLNRVLHREGFKPYCRGGNDIDAALVYAVCHTLQRLGATPQWAEALISAVLKWQGVKPPTPNPPAPKRIKEQHLYNGVDFSKHYRTLKGGRYSAFMQPLWGFMNARQRTVLASKLLEHQRLHAGPSARDLPNYKPDKEAMKVVIGFLLAPTEDRGEYIERTALAREAAPYVLAASKWLHEQTGTPWFPDVYDQRHWAKAQEALPKRGSPNLPGHYGARQ